MSRFPSLRSIWTTARSGILFATIVAFCCFALPAFSQKYDDKALDNYAGYDDEPSRGGSPMDAQGNQRVATITNLASGISRPDNYSSINSVQALIYADTAVVLHFNFGKIDYEGLSAFVDEVVDKGAGSVRSDDKYRVQLREYQKTELKSSFKTFLSTLQNGIVKNFFKNNIDEVYFIEYVSSDNNVLGARIMAIPTDGLSDADVKSTIDALEERFDPITIFVRYGFIIAVIEHDSEVPLDTSEIEALYESKLLQSQNRAYGAYSAPSGNNNNGYGATNGFGNSLSPSSGTSMNGGANNMSQELRKLENQISEAKEKNKSESRRNVLPRIRNRFAKPASESDAAKFMRGLKFSDGAAIAIVFRNREGMSSLLSEAGSDQFASSPFAGLGLGKKSSSKDGFEPNEVLDSFKETLDEHDPDADASCITVSISLVGSPRIITFMGFANENEAKNCEKSVNLLLVAFKPMVLKYIQDALANTDSNSDKVDLSPLVNAIFDGLKPRVSGSDVAVVLDLEPIKTHAAAFMPLLGGVETKSQQEMESETIDWSLGKNNDAKASEDSDDLFDDEEETEKQDDSSESDDPFGDGSDEGDSSEEDEEDPFA